ARRDRAQATLEAALVLPFVLVLLLLVLQVGLIVRDQILVTNAAREAARAAAVDPDPVAPERAARAATTLEPGRLAVRVSDRGPSGANVRVEVTYRAPTDVPLVGPVLPDVELSAVAVMRVEQANGGPGVNIGASSPPSNLNRPHAHRSRHSCC